MQIRVSCPECGKSFLIPERFAGRDGECSNCSAVFHISSRAERVPAASQSPTAEKPQKMAARPAGAQSPARYDAGVTEEMPVYEPETDRVAEDFGAPAAVPDSAAESAEVLTFDITEADLLPDEDDFDDDVIELHSDPAAAVSEVPADTADADAPAVPAKRRSQPGRRSRQSASKRESSAPRRRRAEAEDASELQELSEADLLPEDDDADDAVPAASESSVPVIRRRRSDEESSRSTERPMPAARASVDADADEDTDEDEDEDEAHSRRPPRKSNPRQLLILGGIGAVLLIGAGLYSHFSAPATPALPVLQSEPAPAPRETDDQTSSPAADEAATASPARSDAAAADEESGNTAPASADAATETNSPARAEAAAENAPAQ